MNPCFPFRIRAACLTALIGSLGLDAQDLEPFTLPWDDASPTITDLSGLNTPIPLSASWVKPNSDGHLMRDGERLRFLGVNFGADSAFPYHDDAEKIAARMAKFGYNTVRFHHLEAPWAPGQILIDYSTGRSRDLSAVHLERLHHFVARLADHGIHTNMNLLVSRNLQPGDGFPASIAELEWKEQQCLGFFDDHALFLQKEYATKLLGSANPWRNGIPLARDPAVTFVEILNEYGYVHTWHDGVLDTLPEPFATTHQTHWNDWLATQYANTEALLAAWGAIDEPLGPERLANADFASGTNNWNLEQHSGAVATAAATNDFTGGAPALRITVSTAGSADWHVQFNQSGLSLTAGQIYTVSFWARADTDLPLTATLTRTGPSDYGAVANIANPTLDATWQRFSGSFVAQANEPSLRLNFGGFGNRTGTLWLANASVTTGGQAGTPPAGTSLELRNLPVVRKSGAAAAPTDRQFTDWIRYLLAAENEYFATMYSHIRDELGYPGIIFGTIVANSPAGNQARLDAVDSHHYWQHPRFPGNPWDPVNWTVENVSAVNETDGHIGSIARQRVKGKPFFSTEYQHPAPNTYSSEMPILLSAYAAFQDWDGLWHFDYGGGVNAWDRGYISGFFAQDTHPLKMANNLLAATLFRRGDVAAARSQVVVGFDDPTQLEVVRDAGAVWQVGDGRHLGLSARHAFETQVMLDVTQAAGEVPPAPTADVLTADTGELRWDTSRPERGIVTVDTPRTKAVVGFASGETLTLNDWIFRPGPNSQDWLTAGVTVMTGSSLHSAAGFRAVLVATGNVENTNQQWTDNTRSSVGNQWGEAPVRVEVVPLDLEIPFPPARVSAWALDPRGHRADAVPVTASTTGSLLEFGHSGTTLWYEIEVAADATIRPAEIEVHPTDRLIAPGETFSLSVEATGSAPLNYRWQVNGNDLTALEPFGPEYRATLPPGMTAADYTVTVWNDHGSVTSRSARVVAASSPPASSGLANLSTRANSGTGDAVLIPGFVLTGSGQKEVLMRAVGPGLAQFNVPGAMADPSFTVLARQPDHSQQELATNNDWDSAAIGDAFDRAGAFGLEFGSADAAMRMPIPAGIFTAPIRDQAGEGGVSLVELYDLSNGAGDVRISNLASRGPAGGGSDQLIAGFVIPGDIPRRVLIRAIGPTLADFEVAGAAANPRLEVMSPGPGGTNLRVARNDDWFLALNWAEIRAVAETVGAFALPVTSRDAAAIVELRPGPYTVLVNSVPAGVALVEIYEIP